MRVWIVDQTLLACMEIVAACVAVSFHAAEKSGPDKRGSAHVSSRLRSIENKIEQSYWQESFENPDS